MDRISRIMREVDELFREAERDLERLVQGIFDEIRKRRDKLLKSIEETVRELRERGYKAYATYREFAIISTPEGTAVVPRYDVHDRGDEIEVVVDLPGCEKEDVKVSVNPENGALIVTAKRSDSSVVYKLELSLPIDADTVKATYRNGVLTIKAKKQKPKLREVKVE